MDIDLNEIGLRREQKTPAEVLVELLIAYRTSIPASSDAHVVTEQVRAIQLSGATAYMFGGAQSMDALYRQVEDLDSRAANSLDHLWDGIGSWAS